MKNKSQPIYHLVPASYYRNQPHDRPYQPETFVQEGFIHCTAGNEMLVQVANKYFNTLSEELLVLEINPKVLAVPLKFEPPIPPTGQSLHGTGISPINQDILFPHIYGPLNRKAIVQCFTMQRDETGKWQMPIEKIPPGVMK